MVLREYQHRDVRIPSPYLQPDYIGEFELTTQIGFGVFRTRFSTGTLGPTTFGLDLGGSCLAILFINLIFALPPAYL